MPRRLVATLALLIFLLPGRGARASAIQLLNYEGGVQFSQGLPIDSGFGLPQYLPMILNYGP